MGNKYDLISELMFAIDENNSAEKRLMESKERYSTAVHNLLGEPEINEALSSTGIDLMNGKIIKLDDRIGIIVEDKVEIPTVWSFKDEQ